MKRSVLFVDDEANILRGLRRMLRPMRDEWEMQFASGAKQAKELMAETEFDVVVSDMRMPGTDGSELLHFVQQHHPQAVRIILSGYSDEATLVRAVGAAHQYLSKPCDAETLKETIDRACSLRDHIGPDLQETLGRIGSLPSAPSVYLQLTKALKSENASAQDIADIISRDVGMVAKILQIVNSAFFGLRTTVSSPGRAVALLGIATLRGLVMSTHIFSVYEENIDSFEIDTLMSHSTAVAGIARRIARAEKMSDRDRGDAFLSGMLHDCGKLFLGANLPVEYGRVLETTRQTECSLCEAERELCGVSHGQVGGALLTLWGLPDPIIEAVTYHHEPGECVHQQLSPLTAVHAANAIAVRQCDDLRCMHNGEIDNEYLECIGVADRLSAWQRNAENAKKQEEDRDRESR